MSFGPLESTPKLPGFDRIEEHDSKEPRGLRALQDHHPRTPPGRVPQPQRETPGGTGTPRGPRPLFDCIERKPRLQAGGTLPASPGESARADCERGRGDCHRGLEGEALGRTVARLDLGRATFSKGA